MEAEARTGSRAIVANRQALMAVRAFAAYVMRSRLHAAVVTGVLGALTPILPPVSYLSGAAFGLTVLRRGPADGARVLAGAALVATGLAMAGTGTALPALVLVLALWLPVGLSAAVLRVTVAQGWMLAAVGAQVALVLALLHLLAGDLAAWWQAWLAALQDSLPEGAGVRLGEEERARVAALMTGIVAAAMVTSLAATVLLARWWQALLYNPGGFRQEFYRLRLPGGLLYVTGVIGAAAVVRALGGAAPGLAAELLLVATVLYMFQGLAVIHSRARSHRLSTAWLIVLYALLALVPQYMILLLGMLGAADAMADFRGARRNIDED